MNKIKYFFQFVVIIFLFFIFKLIGLKYSSCFSGIILSFFGPFFRSGKICHSNISRAFPELNKKERDKIIKKMWFNYGRILAEYMFIKDFGTNDDYSKKIVVENQDILEKSEDLKPIILFPVILIILN